MFATWIPTFSSVHSPQIFLIITRRVVSVSSRSGTTCRMSDNSLPEELHSYAIDFSALTTHLILCCLLQLTSFIIFPPFLLKLITRVPASLSLMLKNSQGRCLTFFIAMTLQCLRRAPAVTSFISTILSKAMPMTNGYRTSFRPCGSSRFQLSTHSCFHQKRSPTNKLDNVLKRVYFQITSCILPDHGMRA